MKHLVLLGDGMADFPLDSLGGKTPLAVAKTPAMDTLAREGISGLFCPIPEGYPAGSDIGNLSVFGYNPDECFTGRAPLEAVNQGIDLKDGQLAFRCNLVTLEDGVMKDFTAGHISNEEAAELIETLNENMGSPEIYFHAGVSYRHLGILTPSPDHTHDLVSAKCTPPHDITGQQFEPHLPKGAQSEYLRNLMTRSQKLLADHSVNAKRRAEGLDPATSIWLWGQGTAPVLQSYSDRFDLEGVVVSAVDLVNGIGKAAGLEVVNVEGATGYLDTNYEGKVSAALDALDRCDFAYLHIEAPDEAAHEGSSDLKIQAIEDFDSRVVAPCLAHARAQGNFRILVAPDHITSIASRTHASGPVPFALWGANIHADERTSYSEEEGEKSGILFSEGHTLVPYMITAQEILSPLEL